MQDFTDEDLTRACQTVSKQRLQKILSYLHSIDRKQSAIAELLLHYGLRDLYQTDHIPNMAIGYHGKPMIQSADMLCFNISHCKLAVACAISDKCIGIDVEPYSSYCEDVANEVFNDTELATVIGSPHRFAELWTTKESYLKYTGEGLTDDLKSLLSETEVVAFSSYHSPKGYACTVCSTDTTAISPIIVKKNNLI